MTDICDLCNEEETDSCLNERRLANISIRDAYIALSKAMLDNKKHMYDDEYKIIDGIMKTIERSSFSFAIRDLLRYNK